VSTSCCSFVKPTSCFDAFIPHGINFTLSIGCDTKRISSEQKGGPQAALSLLQS
jgi:hypothetical protein